MHFVPFRSRSPWHKSPFGAVAVGTAVTFRVIMPRSYGCRGVWLLVWQEGQAQQSLPFCWERMEGEQEEWWQVTFTPTAPGLYWYRFAYQTDFGGGDIGLEQDDVANFGSRNCWQLTVYTPQTQNPDWLAGGVMYQIFPDRFCASGSEKKNVPTDRILRADWGGEPDWSPDEQGNITKYDYFGGDLQGITQKLPYLHSLGVTCIYLNPIFEAHSNHRYDTADYEKIDPLLGDEKDFVALCQEAEAYGIRILLDGVFSHTGSDSIYFNQTGRYGEGGAFRSMDSPYFSWYHFDSWPHKYQSWWGISILPELQETDSAYLQFITGEKGVLRKWLRLGAAGWRLDVADELPDQFLDALHTAVKAEKPDAYILGEVWEDASNKISGGGRRRYLQGAQLDSVMNYPFANAIVDFVTNQNAPGLADTVMTILEHYPPKAVAFLMNHIGTHDTVRILNRLGAKDPCYGDRRSYAGQKLSGEAYALGKRRLMLAATLQFTLPGVPCIYYGDEAGLEGWCDPFNRGCYPWGREDADLLGHYRKLGALRQAYRALFSSGECAVLSAAQGCVAYKRTCENQSLIVVANANPHPISYTLPQGEEGYTLLQGEALTNLTVEIPADSTAILIREGMHGGTK